MTDLSKLSPAPWRAQRDGLIWFIPGIITGCDQPNVEFVALARNAFDVMLRRGWHSSGHVRADTGHGYKNWIVMNSFCCKLERGGNTGTYFISSDPFTALVEADLWYRKHVEGKAS